MTLAAVNLAEEPVATEPEPDADMVRLHGAPYEIVAWVNGQNPPETFPMMHIDPAIDAARAIHRDGTYYRVAVRDAYHGILYARFDRYTTETSDGRTVTHQDETVATT